MKILMKILIYIIIIFIILFLTGCGPVNSNVKGSDVLYREVDSEAGVVCYGFVGGTGIDCLQINEVYINNR